MAGAFLFLAGVSPKFAAVLTTIPQCVLGGATITVFSTIAMTGMKLITSQGLNARNTTIVGLSAALGVGISQASSALSQFPESITVIFGKSPVVIATVMAVLLNLILPKDSKDSDKLAYKSAPPAGGALIQFSICCPRKVAMVCASFWSASGSGSSFSSSRSMTQPMRSPSARMGAAMPR